MEAGDSDRNWNWHKAVLLLAKSQGAFLPQHRMSRRATYGSGEHLAPRLLGFSGGFAALSGIPPLMPAAV